MTMALDDWRHLGNCWDSPRANIAMFPNDELRPNHRGGKYFQSTGGLRLCEGCPVLTECLDYAISSHQDFGVWGGTTPHQREALRKEAVPA